MFILFYISFLLPYPATRPQRPQPVTQLLLPQAAKRLLQPQPAMRPQRWSATRTCDHDRENKQLLHQQSMTMQPKTATIAATKDIKNTNQRPQTKRKDRKRKVCQSWSMMVSRMFFFAFELPFFASETLQELTSTTTALTTTSDTRRDHNL